MYIHIYIDPLSPLSIVSLYTSRDDPLEIEQPMQELIPGEMSWILSVELKGNLLVKYLLKNILWL